MTTNKKVICAVVALAGAGVAIEFLKHRPDLVRSLAPPDPLVKKWYEGSWKSEDGKTPHLELAVQKGAVTGQLAEPYGDGGFLASRVVRGEVAQATDEAVLLAIDPKPDPGAGGRVAVWKAQPHLLVRRSDGRRAELYELKPVPGGELKLVRTGDPDHRPVVFFPDALDRHHTRVATLVKSAEEGRP